MIHVIKQGDNLYQLSRKYRIPLGLILRANPYVDVYNLQPGQEICIPVGRPYPGRMPGFGRKPQPQPNMKENNPPLETEEDDEGDNEENNEENSVENNTENAEISAVSADKTEYICDGKRNLGELLQQHNMSVAEFLESNPCDTIIPAEGTSLWL
jgi:LysM repeat protein